MNLNKKIKTLLKKEHTELTFIDKINGVSIYVKKDYLNHPIIQGNKLRKLKYNLYEFYDNKYQTIITFGGAYSNHIHAVAGLGQELGIKTIGIIRGNELENKSKWSKTLLSANKMGMQFHFVTRRDYREKEQRLDSTYKCNFSSSA